MSKTANLKIIETKIEILSSIFSIGRISPIEAEREIRLMITFDLILIRRLRLCAYIGIYVLKKTKFRVISPL